MMIRTPDGSEYRRVEQRPPVNALALIQHLQGLAAARLEPRPSNRHLAVAVSAASRERQPASIEVRPT
jgi:hypothetical protein